jgi:UDP-2-acetamido-3-amino-2,3-dideoxy-glucuronate N-acetyltransferase
VELKGMKKIKGVFIHPLSLVETHNIGQGTRIWAWAHVRPGAKIGKFCNIGEHCYIEDDVLIGDYCTIKNGVCLWDGITLEDHVFVGPGAVFTNDKYPRSRSENWELRRTLVKKYATIGAGAVILCGIEIGAFSMVGAGAVVTKSVLDFSIVVGNPAKIIGYICACGNILMRIKHIKGKRNSRDKIMCQKCGRIYIYEDGKIECVDCKNLLE